MLPLKDAGAFAANDSGKEENTDEEILELEEPNSDGEHTDGENTVSERHHSGRKLV